MAIAAVLQLRRGRLLPGQHFHLYLMGYGVFRFAHEFMRATEKPFFGSISGYQITALLMVVVGAVGFWRRRGSVTVSDRP